MSTVMPEAYLGLRIDVDTYRGTKIGVPNLQKLLAVHRIPASFFFCVGPDNMGRHLFKLLRPGFVKKMIRSHAPSLYGWDILFRGTLFPGPVIGRKCPEVIRSIALDGHEIGLHAWDHHQWQTHILEMTPKKIYDSMRKGWNLLEAIIGRPPSCSAAPGWICSDDVLETKERFPVIYNSDTRGAHIFFPIVNNAVLTRPQIPVTLPTYDEMIGLAGVTRDNFNDHLFSLIKPCQLNVLTIHAEVEGIHCLALFKQFIEQAMDRSITILPLGELLDKFSSSDISRIIQKEITGRDGKVAVQAVEIQE